MYIYSQTPLALTCAHPLEFTNLNTFVGAANMQQLMFLHFVCPQQPFPSLLNYAYWCLCTVCLCVRGGEVEECQCELAVVSAVEIEKQSGCAEKPG